jgi:signal peptidase II
MTPGRTALRALLVAAGVVVLDQATKALVRARIDPFETIRVVPGVKLIRTENSGVAFSALSGGGPLVVIVAIAALGALGYFFFHNLRRPLVWLPTGMLLGGAAGNLIDRVRAGAVTDFIKLPHWPAFNVADISITLGVVVLVLVLERK